MTEQVHPDITPLTTRPRAILWTLVLVSLACIVLSTADSKFGLNSWQQWLRRTPVTLYFENPTGGYLIPVSRSLAGKADSPQDLLAEWLAGPATDSGLRPLISADTRVQRIALKGGTLLLDLSQEALTANRPQAIPALWHSLVSLPLVRRAVITVAGKAVTTPAPNSRMLFYHWRDRLVAQPSLASSPRELLDAYLQGPQDKNLLG
ncbi:MAG: GerMN domain-containing protein, partial [Halopseudomonas sp.]